MLKRRIMEMQSASIRGSGTYSIPSTIDTLSLAASKLSAIAENEEVKADADNFPAPPKLRRTSRVHQIQTTQTMPIPIPPATMSYSQTKRSQMQSEIEREMRIKELEDKTRECKMMMEEIEKGWAELCIDSLK
jgi:hypothetical protein